MLDYDEELALQNFVKKKLYREILLYVEDLNGRKIDKYKDLKLQKLLRKSIAQGFNAHNAFIVIRNLIEEVQDEMEKS